MKRQVQAFKALAGAVQALAEAAESIQECCAALEEQEESGVKLYSCDDLAKMFGKTKGTIRQWISAGEFGEPVKTGNSVMIPQAGLDKYLADHSGPTQKRQIQHRRIKTLTANQNLQSMKI